MCSQLNDLENCKIIISQCFKIYNNYKWLCDSYVLDFYTKDLWDKLPVSWKTFFDEATPETLAKLLDANHLIVNPADNKICPLSLMAIKSVLSVIVIKRSILLDDVHCFDFFSNQNVMKFFWKNVKEKKRHEISVMSEICRQLRAKTNCVYIVDIGSGLGHLSRMLNYLLNFKVVAIEAQEDLCIRARQLDEDFCKLLSRTNPEYTNWKQTSHITMKIQPDITVKQFLKVVQKGMNVIENQPLEFGIVGLHPCGDLGPTLLKLYNECTNAKFIVTAGCCYHKMNITEHSNGFPISDYCKSDNFKLSYESKEMACHAVEIYKSKLLEGEHWKLKIHAYRAALEKIVTKLNPQLSHCAVSSIKNSKTLTFNEYCDRAVKKINLSIPKHMVDCCEIKKDLTQWKNVVTFYSLRLLFAPLIEQILLLDRLIYLQENGNISQFTPVFDPLISPRNLVLTARKL